CLSNPNQCWLSGGRRELASSQPATRGSMSLNSHGKHASSTISSTMLPAIQKIGLRLSSCQASLPRLRAAGGMSGSIMADPGIERGVEQVHDQVGGQINQDQKADDGDHQWAVLEPDSLEQSSTDAGDIEDAFGDHGAAHECTQIRTDEGDD